MNLSLEDSRRLTGANLYWKGPGAIMDVRIEGDQDAVILHWSAAVRELLRATGHYGSHICHRSYQGGASLFVSAPIDALYAMCELNELAWRRAVLAIESGETIPVPSCEDLDHLRSLFAQESRPSLLALQAAAARHGVPFLWDDDRVSVGYGRRSQCWAYDLVPSEGEVNWSELGDIPLALVTGTNGKSTTVRMSASIIDASGRQAGLTSTDFIRVGQHVIDEGDYSGTGGARQLLRHLDVEMAVLEVARGGLLRRGLAVERADVAVVTNVAADHLGEYGINTVPDLIETKFLVRKTLSPDSPLILNADDEGCVAQSRVIAAAGPCRIWWFSLDANNERVRAHLEREEGACWREDSMLFCNVDHRGQMIPARSLASLETIPSTHSGRVLHNVRNAMAAALLCLALGVDDQAIGAGLSQFGSDERDNPGRGNWFEHKGVLILVDFAHNEHGLASVAESVRAMPGKRVVLTIGQAGDRSDELIRAYTKAGCSMSPESLLVMHMPGYERGRGPDEVAGIIREQAQACGVPIEAIETLSSPLEAARKALENARSGDVLVLLALTQRKEVLNLVHGFIDG